jgi:hypothetical protein
MRKTLLTLSSLSIALATAGLVHAQTGRFYDPSNVASPAGVTTGKDLFRTIGCPGRQLLDPPCPEDPPAPVVERPKPAAPVVTPKPVAKPDPCPLPPGAIVGDLPPNARPGQCFAKVIRPATFRTETVRKLVKEASERIETVPAVYETVKEKVLVKDCATSFL